VVKDGINQQQGEYDGYTGWWFQTWFLFSIICGMSSFPTDELIFFKIVKTANQIGYEIILSDIYRREWLCHRI